MASVKICDGRTVVYQYDTGVSIELCDCRDFTECHFAVNDGIIRRDVEDNICSVPDAALMNAGTLTVYAFSRNDDGGQTQHTFFIHVMARPKPADYIDPQDEMDNLKQLAERLKDEIDIPEALFVVNAVLTDPDNYVYHADKTVNEIREAVIGGKGCVLQFRSRVFTFYKDDWTLEGYRAIQFVEPMYYGETGKIVNSFAYIKDDGTVLVRMRNDLRISNPKAIKFAGAVTGEYDGSKEITVTIPEGGVSEAEIGEAVDNALTEAKESGDFKGEPGTSVTITNITQSTEDDGYSVVTFSDGKQLRVKNGSKGSPGEGGSGGSSDPEVVTVMCVPSDDFQSFTADKGFADIHMALAAGKLVQAYVHALGAYAPIVMFNEDVAMFGVTLAMEGNVIAVSLVMSADGTNILSGLPIIGEPGEGEEETAKDTLVVTYEDYGNGSSMVTHTVEQIYAEYTAGRKVVLLIADGVLYHAEHISSDECRFVRYSFDADGSGTRSVAVMPNHGLVKFTHEAIPADRQNPHPLVINGVSYDGSKRVEMNVSAAAPDAVVLADTVTGRQYRLCVTNGKLTMDETASARASSGEVFFTDTETRKKYRLRVINAELTMEEVVES